MMCEMVWAELKLEKLVDWTTLKAAPSIYIPTEQNVPQDKLKFPGGGLSVKRTIPKKWISIYLVILLLTVTLTEVNR